MHFKKRSGARYSNEASKKQESSKLLSMLAKKLGNDDQNLIHSGKNDQKKYDSSMAMKEREKRKKRDQQHRFGGYFNQITS